MQQLSVGENYLTGLVRDLYGSANERNARQFLGMTLIDDAVGAGQVLGNTSDFRKNYAFLSLLGHSRFSSDNSDWENRRKLTQPIFVSAAQPGCRHAVRDHYVRAFDRIQEGNGQSIEAAMLAGSASVFLSAFSTAIDQDQVQDFFERTRTVCGELQFHSWQPPDRATVDELQQRADDLLAMFQNIVCENAALSALLGEWTYRARAVAGFSALQEFMMNFFAGVETTAAALCWAVDRLGVNPSVQQRLQEEVASGNDFPYLDCFINETLRYFPPIPFVVRQAAVDTLVGDLNVAAGQMVLLSIIGVHQDPDFWEEPAVFDASRRAFLERAYDRQAFIPFLTGQRMCGGARLARMELTEVLSAFVQRYVVQTDGPDVAFKYSLALRPARWSAVSIQKRR